MRIFVRISLARHRCKFPVRWIAVHIVVMMCQLMNQFLKLNPSALVEFPGCSLVLLTEISRRGHRKRYASGGASIASNESIASVS